MWTVRYLPEARAERAKLDARERAALQSAVEKLQALGPELPFPHSSAVQGADRLRELRLKAGRGVTRALYRRIGDDIVIGAVGPEAQVDGRGFRKACRNAERRLDEEER